MNNDKTESISDKLRRISAKGGNCYCEAAGEYGIECFDTKCSSCRRLLMTKIADEIDAEKQSILRNCAYPLTQEVGKPLKEDEDFESWLDHWYFEKPVDENNEPVDFGQTVVDKMRGEIDVNRVCYTKTGWYFNESRHGCALRKPRNISYGYGERVKRPNPQVLDADGVPIEVGDKVWMLPGKHCKTFPLYGYKAGVEYTVSENESDIHKEDGRICITGGDFTYGYPMPEQVTHREPDSQERIDRDATKDEYEYWGCTGSECHNCPALVDGKKPKQRYGVFWCNSATRLDLLRRQRELDGRDA